MTVVEEFVKQKQQEDAGLMFSGALGHGKVGGGDKLETFDIGTRGLLSEPQLTELYDRANPLANLIDLLPDAAAQKWVKVESKTIDEDKLKKAQKVLDQLKEHLTITWKQARLYGWAAIVPLYDGGGDDLSKPLDPLSVKGIKGFRSVSGGVASDIYIESYEENPLSEYYGSPSHFTLRGLETQRIHRSRLSLLYGVRKLRRVAGSHEIGISVVERAYTAYRNYDATINTIANSLIDFSVDVLEMENLTTLMSQSEDFAKIITAMHQAKTQLKVMLLEHGKAKYSQIQRSYTGVKDMMELMQVAVASSADIPLQMVFNVSPSGQTSGSWEKEYFSQYVANRQRLDLEPVLREILDINFESQGVEDYSDYSLDFPNILEQTELEQAEHRYRDAQSQYNLSAALKLLVEAQILAPEEGAKVIAGEKNLEEALTEGLASLKMRVLLEEEGGSEEEAPTGEVEAGSKKKMGRQL